MMRIYGVNGGPRKNWNTATMLEHFLQGARSAGAEVETIHLFDLDYTGCRSCFLCKCRGPTYGRCSYRDGLQPVLEKLRQADGIAFASPIYFHQITAQLRGLLERLFFQYHSFERGGGSLAPQKIETAVLYTMNVTEEEMRRRGYPAVLGDTEQYFSYTFYAEPQRVYAFDTYEFTDYSQYRADYWDEPAKRRWHQEQFPRDCQNAFDAGVQMAARIGTDVGR